MTEVGVGFEIVCFSVGLSRLFARSTGCVHMLVGGAECMADHTTVDGKVTM
jgi:hypothetical protein